MKENIDINAVITSISNDKYDEFLVTFKSSKGFLEESYDEEAYIQKTKQRFNDIVLPLKVRMNTLLLARKPRNSNLQVFRFLYVLNYN